ncbi:3059_t:CDS:2, partial [Funneliformis mosseae]
RQATENLLREKYEELKSQDQNNNSNLSPPSTNVDESKGKKGFTDFANLKKKKRSNVLLVSFRGVKSHQANLARHHMQHPQCRLVYLFRKIQGIELMTAYINDQDSK